MDYSDPNSPTIGVYFEWYPALTAGARGTILATEGGPGYPTTGSRDDYRGLFGSLLNTHNLLMVDLRGTGRSSVIKCAGVQHWTEASNTDQQYINAVGACGRQLDHTWQRADGAYVAASDLFTTANAARDVDLVLHRLHTGKVDFYGDSYGTFFGQTLTARFPGDLRSVTLDAAYPVQGENPFYPDITAAAEHAFDVSCARSVACSTAAPGSSWKRVGELAVRLRRHALTGTTHTPDGIKVTETIGIDQLIELINIAGADSGVYHDLDPATRAYLDGSDPAPLLRLAAQEIDTGDSGPYRQFSAGLYAATSCSDYPQPFGYREPVKQRVSDYAAAVKALPPGEFAPFTVAEWVTEPEEEFD
ncbi:MAG TPA: alpha/beta fold hydrolase, partial [Micromonosporaceae bacterium]